MLGSEKFRRYPSGYVLRAKNRILRPNEVMSTGRFVVIEAVWLRINVLWNVKLCLWVSDFRRLQGSWCPYLQADPSIRRHHDPSKDPKPFTQRQTVTSQKT
jgi:hypothetical protein